MEERYGNLADEFSKLKQLHEQHVKAHSILAAEKTALIEAKSELVQFSLSLYIIAQIILRCGRMRRM